MRAREWLNNNSAVVAAGAAVLLVLLLIFHWHFRSEGHSPLAYFYDPEADEFFLDDAGELAPVETPSGGMNGLRAVIYACGQCPRGIAGMTMDELEQSNALVARFERYSEEARRILEEDFAPSGPEDVADLRARAMDEGLFIREPDGDQWYRADGARGMEIGDPPAQVCEGTGERLGICLP